MKIRIEMEIPGIDGDLSRVLEAAEEFAKQLAEENPGVCRQCEGSGSRGLDDDDCEACDGSGEPFVDNDAVEASVSVQQVRDPATLTPPLQAARAKVIEWGPKGSEAFPECVDELIEVARS